jgi:hypothetical protein
MTSSIFSFELPFWRGAGDAPSWRRFALTTVLTAIGLSIALLLLLALADPYDTGRFSLMPDIGVSDGNPRTANASDGRSARFNAAIIGNSRGQYLDPPRLSALTGLSFARLTMQGSGPREQLAVMRWFARHHRTIGAIVLAADQTWCIQDPALPILHPFPFWLYSDSKLEYLGSLLNSQALTLLWRRTRLWLGLRQRYNAAESWDYRIEATLPRDQLLAIPFSLMNEAVPPDAPYPAIDRLRAFIASLPRETPVVIAMPPAYYTALPPPGGNGAARLARCKALLSELVAGRPHSGFADFVVDGPLAHDKNNFIDLIHYQRPMAMLIEDAIAEKLNAR